MRAPRWALALGSLSIVGSSTLVVGLPTPAAADDTRYNLEARGDAFYFEVDGDEIPVSPQNDSGSLTAEAQTTSIGGSKGFAGAPYWGSTVQYAPGTVNGVPNQFGLGQFQLPFAVLPGYVSTSSNGPADTKQADLGYGRIQSSSSADGSSASAFYGAPQGSTPAPNQQQTASASTGNKGSSVSALASGSSSGFVTGPLEVGNSTTLASIAQTVGSAPVIESKTFGRFSVGGQEFGFDQNGFHYLGQSTSSKDAFAQADDALKNAGIAIQVAPATTSKDDNGRTIYTIGGLMVTTTQQTSPTGSGGKFTVTYILGRAKVGATVASLGAANVAHEAPAGVQRTSSGSAGRSPAATSHLVTRGLPAAISAQASSVPTAVATLTDKGTVVPVTDDDRTTVGAADSPKTLGFALMSGQSGRHSESLYLMLMLTGLVVGAAHWLFARSAKADGARRGRS